MGNIVKLYDCLILIIGIEQFLKGIHNLELKYPYDLFTAHFDFWELCEQSETLAEPKAM